MVNPNHFKSWFTNCCYCTSETCNPLYYLVPSDWLRHYPLGNRIRSFASCTPKQNSSTSQATSQAVNQLTKTARLKVGSRNTVSEDIFKKYAILLSNCAIKSK
ncbi:hypothetical protein NIES2130_08905 [Scytonema sp. HK-05]|nr:hypothetical protein NIES2130_08905 [Scytonema sp. HK-05]